MAKTTPIVKPGKPYVGFPLFCHASGRWAKKVRGRFVYFGKWKDDPKGERALAQYLDEKDTLYAGGRRRRKGELGPTMADICSDFLDSKEAMVKAGEILFRTFRRTREMADFLVEHFGKRRLVLDLTPRDFEGLRAKLAETLGPVALGNQIQAVRSVFRFAYEAELIDRPIRFGPSFKKPSSRVVRVARARNGERMFEAAELRAILDAADTQLKAAVMLGINGGFGQTDVANLPLTAIDFEGGWLAFARHKTGVSRKTPCWPETLAALREAIDQRPKPKGSAAAALALLAPRGRPWVETSKAGANLDRLGQAFGKLLGRLELKRPSVSFYSLRRTFQTVADEARDPVATSALMGHVAASSDMAAIYRQRISDARLRAVVDHVRAWLFGKGKKCGTNSP